MLVLIVTCLYLNSLILQWLLDKLRLVALALVLPAAYIEVVLVVALCLAFLGLILLAEVTTARLITRESVESYFYVGCWEYKGKGNEPELIKEPLEYEAIKVQTRNYKN